MSFSETSVRKPSLYFEYSGFVLDPLFSFLDIPLVDLVCSREPTLVNSLLFTTVRTTFFMSALSHLVLCAVVLYGTPDLLSNESQICLRQVTLLAALSIADSVRLSEWCALRACSHAQ